MYTGAGFVLLSPDFRVLLVQDAKTKKWGFPKGHREPEETSDMETAQRELLEETGIPNTAYVVYDVPFRIIRGSSSYIFRYAITKTTEPIGAIQCRGEISAIQWVPLAHFFLYKDAFMGVAGNKYLRTWIDDVIAHSDRKSNMVLQQLIQFVVDTSTAAIASTLSSCYIPVTI